MSAESTVYTTKEVTVYALIEPEEPKGDELWAVPKAHGYVLRMLLESGILGRADEQEDIEVGTPLTVRYEMHGYFKVDYLLFDHAYHMWIPVSCVSPEAPAQSRYPLIG